MKTTILLIIFNTKILAFNTQLFKEAIAEVETGNVVNWSIGASGEKTKYQFMKSTWESYSSYPFEKIYWHDTRSANESERVMDLHIKWMHKNLQKQARMTIESSLGLDEVFWLALIHNAGYGRFKRGEWKDRHIDYAKRVYNIYDYKVKRFE